MESLGCESCTYSTVYDLLHYNSRIVIVVSGAVALSLECAVLAVLLYNKAIRTFLQRLFVWIVLSLIIMDITRVAAIGFHPEEAAFQDKTCAVLGLIFFWSGWWFYIFLSVLLAYFAVMMCLQTRDNPIIIAKLKASKLSRVVLEIGTILASLILPGMVLWVPFDDNDIEYGFNGYMCELRQQGRNNISKGDIAIINFYFYAPVELAGLVAALAGLAMVALYCTLSSKPVHQHARRVIRNLIISFLVVITFTAVTTTANVISNKGIITNFLAMLCISLMITNLEKIALLIGYLLLFHFSKVCGPLERLVKRRRKENCHTQQSNYRTFGESNRNTAPSYTYFSSFPYTGGFTNISTAA